jgi:hypothetical protein
MTAVVGILIFVFGSVGCERATPSSPSAVDAPQASALLAPGDAEVNLLEPEFIVYSPTKNGGMRLSAADYFVPYAFVPRDADPPTLLGVPFAQEDAFGAWVLHIWAFWPNPAGMFENFNPDVPPCP